MIVPTNARLEVKYSDGTQRGKLVYYQVNKGRDLDSIVKYFTAISGFRQATIVAYNRTTKEIGYQIAYFNKYRTEIK